MSRRRLVRNVPKKPTPVPEGTPVLSPEVEKKLREAGLVVKDVILTEHGRPASMRFSDTNGDEHGLVDLEQAAGLAREKHPEWSMLGAALAEFMLAAKTRDPSARAARMSATAASVILKKGIPRAQQEQERQEESPAIKGTSSCWFSGHAICDRCGGCERNGCQISRCTCENKP